MTLIDRPLTATQLRPRVLAQLKRLITCTDQNCPCQQGNGVSHGERKAA